MIRSPEGEERAFVRNTSQGEVTFHPGTKKLRRGGGVWVDEHWGSFEEFKNNHSVNTLFHRNRIQVEYHLPEEPISGGSAC